MKLLTPLLFLTVCTFGAVRQDATQTMKPAGKISPHGREVITPEAGPQVDNGIDAFITGDFIYWTARVDGLGYITTGVSDGTVSSGKGSTKQPNFGWEPGFKAGIGLNLPHDGWDVYAEYTWLHSSATDNHRSSGNGMSPNWNIANISSFLETPETITSARTNWKLQFSSIDISVGRNYFISQFLTLRPFIGFKGSWIDMDYHVRYTVSNTDTDSILRMKNDQDFWGLGTRPGLNTAFHLAPAWSIYGNFALSALWCQFEIKRRDTRNDSRNSGGANNPPLNTEVTQFNSENDFHTLKGVLEFGIGLRGEWWFANDRYHFLIQGGWEEQVWINFNNLTKISFVEADKGDLGLQGFTLKLRFDF